ncbi:Disease resistance protein RML1A [Vitis vinifera]|uniref:Disease resistance protein RML1A n=1 Tax=Vitis vinifera TaxID=29760 RepID=A0A438HEI8_VITVI|nr:Disease resistance protein RML1A [Vitis vinifera]
MASKPFIMDCPSTNEFILKDLVKFMNIQSEDVHMIGIYGEDGLGKTAIAQAICNEISSQFEGCSFLANIRKVSKEYFGLQRLQEQLFRDILVLRGNREIIFHRRNDVIKQICCRKVLIILDDVDELEQLQFLARESNWFGKGSMIIITCTDKEILTRHSVKLSYELTKLKNPEDVRLFTQHAISKGRSLCNIHKLLERAIDYCCGLPLALKVVGTFLKTKTREQWEKALIRSYGCIIPYKMWVGKWFAKKIRKKVKEADLWDHDNVEYVLTHNKGTDAIEGIVLDLSELNQLQFTTEAFAKMTELRVLKFFMGCKNVCEESCKVLFSGDLELPVSDLRYLHWHGYPSDSFPSNFLKADALLSSICVIAA